MKRRAGSVNVIRIVKHPRRFQAESLIAKEITCPCCKWVEFYNFTNGKIQAVGYGDSQDWLLLECDRCRCQFMVAP